METKVHLLFLCLGFCIIAKTSSAQLRFSEGVYNSANNLVFLQKVFPSFLGSRIKDSQFWKIEDSALESEHVVDLTFENMPCLIPPRGVKFHLNVFNPSSKFGVKPVRMPNLFSYKSK